jgi:membrane protein YdbS with pleckstrin-like domain
MIYALMEPNIGENLQSITMMMVAEMPMKTIMMITTLIWIAMMLAVQVILGGTIYISTMIMTVVMMYLTIMTMIMTAFSIATILVRKALSFGFQAQQQIKMEMGVMTRLKMTI